MSNELRFLCADMVEKANSGHPGAPMGLAEIITALSGNLRHNPKNPNWLNRDRLVFSGGHASSLVYAFLYLSGYALSMDDLKAFRRLGSKTPGHPEITTPGVEIATGPLGQGVANAVGLAMAAKSAASLLGDDIINHKVYCLCGDGDLQEGISYEACALAGHHRLDNLVLIYDSNRITIEGDTNVAWSENVKARFEAQGFEVAIINGHCEDEIKLALSKQKEKPYLIIANTVIAKGALDLEGSHKAHGAPLGAELLAKAKEAAGIKGDFSVSEDVLFAFRAMGEKGELANAKWDEQVKNAGKKELLDAMPPFLYGGDMIEYVHEDKSTFAPSPEKFEAGTQNVEAVYGLGAAIDFMQSLGLDEIKNRELALTSYAAERLVCLDFIDMYYPKNNPEGTNIIFNVKGVHPHDVASILDYQNVAIRSGHHCTQPLHRYLGLNASCRVSIAFYNTKEEIDKFIESLFLVKEMLI